MIGRYAERLGAIVRRFLVLELKLRASGVTSVNDTVGSAITVLWRNCSQGLNVKAQFTSSKDRLLKGAERETSRLSRSRWRLTNCGTSSLSLAMSFEHINPGL